MFPFPPDGIGVRSGGWLPPAALRSARAPVAQWTERLPSKQRAAGSNPAGGIGNPPQAGLASAPDLDCLLAQPGGFEGTLPVRKDLDAIWSPVSHPGDVRDALLHFGPAPVADGNRADEGDDGVPGVKQLLHLDAKLSPDVKSRFQE